MENLTSAQSKAWHNAYQTALDLGLTARQATDAANNWAERTNFGKSAEVTYSLGGRRSDKPSSNIGELFADAVKATDPTYEPYVWSGQEPALGLGRLTSRQRREHQAYMNKGFDSETASRIVNRVNSEYRHPLGLAIDADVKDISGKPIRDRDITDKVAFQFVQATGGNVGRGGPSYMEHKGRNHYDIAPLRPGMGQFWGELGPKYYDEALGAKTTKFLQEMDQANRLHAMGMTDSSKLPFPTGRGVSTSDYVVNALANNTEPEWSSQFAPGGGGLLGAEPITPQAPLEYFGPPAPRSDLPTGSTDPAPWVDDFAPAPTYPPRMASREGFEKTLTQPDPHAPVLQPGMSDRARAMRDLADRMARAGVAGLNGRPVIAAPVPRRGPVAPAGVVPVPAARPELMGWPKPSSIPVPRSAPRRGAELAPQHDAITPVGPYASGPKKQIFDFVLGQLLNPGWPAK